MQHKTPSFQFHWLFESVQHLVMYARKCVNVCVCLQGPLHFVFPLFHFLLGCLPVELNTEQSGGSEQKAREGELGGFGAFEFRAIFPKFDPISLILKPAVFRDPSTLLSSLLQAEKPECQSLWSNIITHPPTYHPPRLTATLTHWCGAHSHNIGPAAAPRVPYDDEDERKHRAATCLLSAHVHFSLSLFLSLIRRWISIDAQWMFFFPTNWCIFISSPCCFHCPLS